MEIKIKFHHIILAPPISMEKSLWVGLPLENPPGLDYWPPCGKNLFDAHDSLLQVGTI